MRKLKLHQGQHLSVELKERQDPQHWIVSYEGHLFQVKNLSGSRFEENQKIILEVVKVKPLELRQIAQPNHGHGRFRIRV